MRCQPIAPCFRGIPYPLKKVALQNRLHNPITGEVYTVANPPSVDEIIPISRGGLPIEENRWLMGKRENTEKGRQWPDKYFKYKQRRIKNLHENITISFIDLLPFAPNYVDSKVPIISRYLGKKIRV